jgi:hypothetical protein
VTSKILLCYFLHIMITNYKDIRKNLKSEGDCMGFTVYSILQRQSVILVGIRIVSSFFIPISKV